MRQTEHVYIVTDENILSGEPIIKGTRTPVRAIVEIWRQGVSAETIPSRLPHLTLAQVFDALSYYSDHQDQINSYIKSNHFPERVLEPVSIDTYDKHTTTYEHIVLDRNGRAIIEGTRIKVKHLAADHTAWAYGPEALLHAYPHLTLGQILSALAYYYDHKEVIDAEIGRDAEYADRLRSEQQEDPVTQKLRKLKEALAAEGDF
ncbi:gll2956 [Gloeobacter violaceus PCC 7421]|uniref:Gll2956 protein n=1 Tax=Gloeobacter violaceus (strain ATCC 29082 / PCC 7421) TaxID=251221 RepID=Q7NCM2_GLOVI|nr:DUF433 domain-containing protein [Gloeobacter violaceus]BAC90897.1 gll2956 [Gloeobacter violaceus PCC 7421]